MKKFSSAADLARLELWMPSSLRVFESYRDRQPRSTAQIDGSTCVQPIFLSQRLQDTFLARRVDSPRFLAEDAHGFRRNAYFRLVERSSDHVSRDFSLPGAWNERCEKNRSEILSAVAPGAAAC